jgi:hypothetical protein
MAGAKPRHIASSAPGNFYVGDTFSGTHWHFSKICGDKYLHKYIYTDHTALLAQANILNPKWKKYFG